MFCKFCGSRPRQNRIRIYKEEQINEFTDLIYHLLVLMVDRSISIKEIEEKLIKRSKKINNFKGERKNIEKL